MLVVVTEEDITDIYCEHKLLFNDMFFFLSNPYTDKLPKQETFNKKQIQSCSNFF